MSEKMGKPIGYHRNYVVGMPHRLKAMCHTFSVCLSRSAGNAIEAISLALHNKTSV